MDAREARLAAVSGRQHGVFTRGQAVAAGFSRSTVARRVRTGVWETIVGDACRVRAAVRTWEQPLVAAYLAAGRPCAISHLSAAALLGLAPDPGPQPSITVPVRRSPRLDEVAVVRTRRWGRLEVVARGSVHVTHVHRTLLDLAPLVDELDLERMIDLAHRRRVLDIVRFCGYLERAGGRRVQGARRVLDLARLRDPSSPMESALETTLFAVLRRFRLPLPQPQHWVQTRNGRRRIDFAYVERRVALEVDGYEGRDRSRFDDDRARDNELADLGWERRHITWTMLAADPAETAWTVARALGLSPASWR
ncbi:MAG TPA: type IV toxin-antitoxin system AbiEi family antitoxin domain-containing protein [Actinomycetota bacterium]|nr:type IV toxin-antitoxin system AbiEi family antitoxin domain-containing protein [Actinomycetota bacterium]